MRRTGNERTGNRIISVPVKAGTVLTEATMAVINADGYAEPAAAVAGLKVAGCVQNYCDNRTGTDGEVAVKVKRGVFVWENDGSIKTTDLLKPCYIKDETTVTITAAGSSPAGVILEVAADGVTVDMTQGIRDAGSAEAGSGQQKGENEE